MNRLSICQPPVVSTERPADELTFADRVAEPPRKRMQACSQDASCHFYFAPLHYEPNYSYPLIVWLHGPHNNELELKQIMPLVSMRNYVAAAPRGTAPSVRTK